MSQAPVILPGAPLTGAQAAADMNAAWAAMISLFSGTAAPTQGPGASGALVEGQDWLDTSMTPNVWRKWDGAAWCPFATIDTTNHVLATPLSWRNVMGDNGGMEVWQRGAGSAASFAVPASTIQYTADRWYVQTNATQASVVAAVAGLTANSNLALKFTRNSGQSGTGVLVLSYPLDSDEISHLIGNKVTVRLVVKAGANWSPTLGTFIVELFTGLGAPVRRQTTPFTTETGFVIAGANLAVNQQASIGGTTASVVPVGTTQAELSIFWTPTGTAGADDSITIDDVQLEVGTFSSPFERTPFEKMLLGCRRHFWKTFPYSSAPVQNFGSSNGELWGLVGVGGASPEFLWVRHSVSMRANPSVTTFNTSAANAQVRDITAGADCSATTVNTSTPEAILITTTAPVGATVGQLLGVHAAVDAGI
jgi:hypothetical protein